ncbi:fatty acid--CoA ligase [Micromonospora sp. WMMD734]|nr:MULTISPECIES: fatty acid--CoA ligase [Micromonospora]
MPQMHYPNLKTVVDTATFHAERHPDRVAIECEGREVTFAQLHRGSNRSARAILAAGVTPGSRVGYLGKESEYYYEIVFACAKSGAVLVPINWRLTPTEIEHILRDSGTELLFTEREFRATALDLQREQNQLRLVVDMDGEGELGAGFRAWTAEHSADDLDTSVQPEDPIVQLYTSGTTGLPKGVVLPHRSFFRINDLLVENDLDWLDWRSDDKSLIGIPGFHVAGLWWALQALNAGVTSVAMRRFLSTEAATLIRESGITTTLVVPAMLQMILAEPRVGSDDFASLRKVAYGGSPISESLLRQSLDAMGCEFVQLYGLTETGNCAVCLPAAEHVPGSPRMRAAGRPMPGVDLRVVDADGVEVPQGEVGEVWLRTPAIMIEYWGLKEATDEVFVDGWFRTGDAGYLDQDGYLYISDRIKDTIIVAGENVYPAEVENALCKHPAVAEAAVIGVPDERWGEAVRAFVVLRPGQQATPRELMLSLKGLISDFKIPAQYDIIDKVPRNPSGKILRRILRDQFWAHVDRNVN